MQLDPSIIELLEKLKKQIRSYVLIEGISIVLISIGIFFWLSLGIDAAWFSFRRLELPVWFRQMFVFVTLASVTYLVVRYLVGRLLFNIRSKALALVLERRFPNLDDRLITAVEMADEPQPATQNLTSAMVRRTVNELSSLSKQLNPAAVFDSGPIRKAATIAVIMIVSFVGFAAANKPALDRWARGYLMFEEEYWARETNLKVEVIAQPGDRVRQFVDGIYKHPRGDDLTISVTNLENSKAPSQVVLSYRTEQGLRGTVPMSLVSEGLFQHTITGVLENMQIWVTGGDFTNRRPFQVTMVEPPRVDKIDLLARFPNHTNLNDPDESGRTLQPVLGTSTSVPIGTDFVLRAETNKSLVAAQIRSDRLDLDIVRSGKSEESESKSSSMKARLTLKSEIGDPIKTLKLTDEQVESILGKDKKLEIPFVMSPKAIEELANADAMPWPIPFPADTELRIYLHDTDDVIGSDPTRTEINGVVDLPPQITTELRGIGTSITRKAIIPVTGFVTDDYGVVKAEFLYNVDGPKPVVPIAFRNTPTGEREFKLQYEEGRPFERFEVLPLNLDEGQTLVLTVAAEDGDTVLGPNKSNGEVYRFNIVSDEELLSQLYQKELNLRRRFEQMIEEIKKTRDDIEKHRDQYEQVVINKTDATKSEDISNTKLAVTSCSERSLYAIRQNATESIAVAEVFRDIRDEMINNSVDTPQMMERINDKILRPFDEINNEQFPLADEHLGRYKHTNEQGLDPREPMSDTLVTLDRMIEQMENILNEMRKLESFHEAIELLKVIIEQQKELKAKTEEEKKKNLIDDLFN